VRVVASELGNDFQLKPVFYSENYNILFSPLSLSLHHFSRVRSPPTTTRLGSIYTYNRPFGRREAPRRAPPLFRVIILVVGPGISIALTSRADFCSLLLLLLISVAEREREREKRKEGEI
jgi:hypothetical protein